MVNSDMLKLHVSSRAVRGLLSHRSLIYSMHVILLSFLLFFLLVIYCLLEKRMVFEKIQNMYIHCTHVHDSIAHQLEADCLFSSSVVTSIWLHSPVWKMVLTVHSMNDASNKIMFCSRDGLIAQYTVWNLPVYTMLFIDKWCVTTGVLWFHALYLTKERHIN